jgi:hypothetical protein
LHNIGWLRGHRVKFVFSGNYSSVAEGRTGSQSVRFGPTLIGFKVASSERVLAGSGAVCVLVTLFRGHLLKAQVSGGEYQASASKPG